MSYTNPKQYIDNQSAQIQQNLQKNLAAITAKTTSDIGKIYAENSRLNKELIKRVDSKISKQTNAAIQTHKKNPSVKMGEIYKLSKYVADIKKSNPSSWTENQRNTVSSWDSLADRMQNTFENTLSADPTGALKKTIGQPGSIDNQRDYEKNRVILAMSNLIPSEKISQFPIDETGFINYNILVKENGIEIGNVINDTPENTMEMYLIPDIIKSIDEGNAKVAAIIDAGNPLSTYYEGGEPAQYKDKKTGKVIMEGRKMNLEKVKNTWIETQKSNDYIGLDKSGQVSLYQTQYKDKNDPNYSYDNPTEDELKIMEEKYIDKEFNRFLAANPKIYAALENPKAPKPTPSKKLTAAQVKYNDQFEMANTAMIDMKELMETPLKKIRNRKFTMEEKGAFVDVINRYRKEAEGKVQTMEQIKADYILEEGEDAWNENYGNLDLNTVGYVKVSNGKKVIKDLNIGTYDQKIETFVDLIYPGLEKTKRNKMKKGLKGNEVNQDYN
jgi:hypothetical protein